MIASAHWLRVVAEKYGIEGVDLRVVEGCAQQLERLPRDLEASINLVSHLRDDLVALNAAVRGEYRKLS